MEIMPLKIDTRQLFGAFKAHGKNIGPELRDKLLIKLSELICYEPRIGIFGKSGIGKSSAIKGTLGTDACNIADVIARNPEPQDVLIHGMGNNRTLLIDVPCIGESTERDGELEALYKKILPELDLVLWLFNIEDGTFESDKKCYTNFVLPILNQDMPFLIVINQGDIEERLAEGGGKSDKAKYNQAVVNQKLVFALDYYFKSGSAPDVSVMASCNLGLIALADSIINILPDDKKLSVLKDICKENRSIKSEREAVTGLVDTLRQADINVGRKVPIELIQFFVDSWLIK